MGNNQPSYYDGRDLHLVAKNVLENQKNMKSVVVSPEIPKGMKLQVRYPHPYDGLSANQ